jgi:hypothetical protein
MINSAHAYGVKSDQIVRLRTLHLVTPMRPDDSAALFEEIAELRDELKRLHVGNHALTTNLRTG